MLGDNSQVVFDHELIAFSSASNDQLRDIVRKAKHAGGKATDEPMTFTLKLENASVLLMCFVEYPYYGMASNNNGAKKSRLTTVS